MHPQHADLPSELQTLRERLARLSQQVAGFWLQSGPDWQHGGFHATLDVNGAVVTPTDKGLIQQARHLWTWSMWHQRRSFGGSQPSAAPLAHSTYRFLRTHFLDASDGEFCYRVTREGHVKDRKKVLYAQAFAIYGLSEYARVFHLPAAADLALQCFRALDARAHDSTHGGYDQVNDAPWLEAETRKETNTHLHLLEALTTLHDVTQDPLVALRLDELLKLFLRQIFQAPGYFHMRFARDFTPLAKPALSYGHDLETAWLLLEAARSLGRRTEPELLRVVTLVATNAEAWGYDSEHGGYFEAGIPAGPVTKTEKIWWVQAEALPGLLCLYQLTADPGLLQRMAHTLDFIEGSLRVPKTGEWYWGVLPSGQLGPRGTHLGEEWKTAYHNLRALVYTEDWIADLLRS